MREVKGETAPCPSLPHLHVLCAVLCPSYPPPVRYYWDKDEKALDAFPGGSEPGSR